MEPSDSTPNHTTVGKCDIVVGHPDPRFLEAQHLVLTIRPTVAVYSNPKALKRWELQAKKTVVQLSGRSGVLVLDTAYGLWLQYQLRDPLKPLGREPYV